MGSRTKRLWWAVLALVAVGLGAGAGLPAGAAEPGASAPAEGSLELTGGRDHLIVLASPLQRAFADKASERFTARTGVPVEVRTVLAVPAIKDFCSGAGGDFADIVAVPRRMAKRELERCIENGVLDVIELKLGFDALVVAVKKGDPVFNITPRQVYYALAAEIPHQLHFVANPNQSWKDVDPNLPNLPINVLGPAEGTVIFSFMKDIFMEGGCRGVGVFKTYYNADNRVRQCTTLRKDGHFQEVKAPIALNVIEPLQKSPTGTVAIIPYTAWLRHQDQFDVMPVQGVLPSHRSINDDDYEAVYPVRFYVKRSNMSPQLGGNGEAPGLYAFIQEIMAEEALGPGGYLEQLGLVLADPQDREANRQSALRLDRFTRD